jgi:2,4-dienoyl-CoA reductase-like NADH-dependent reductase (Old Yellow Enzyme family)
MRLAEVLANQDVDVLDVSSGGNYPRQKIIGGNGCQAPAALQVKETLDNRLLVGTVGGFNSGTQADGLLNSGLDTVFVRRLFQKNPGLVRSSSQKRAVRFTFFSFSSTYWYEMPQKLIHDRTSSKD